LTNTLSLGRLGKKDLGEYEPEGDNEENYEESAKQVNYNALRDSEDGAVF